METEGATSMAASNMLSWPSESSPLAATAGAAVAAGAALGVAASPKSRRDKVRNSSSSSRGASAAPSGADMAMSSKFSSNGMSRTMVASSRDKNASSRLASTFSFILPFSWSRLSYRPSMEP